MHHPAARRFRFGCWLLWRESRDRGDAPVRCSSMFWWLRETRTCHPIQCDRNRIHPIIPSFQHSIDSRRRRQRPQRASAHLGPHRSTPGPPRPRRRAWARIMMVGTRWPRPAVLGVPSQTHTRTHNASPPSEPRARAHTHAIVPCSMHASSRRSFFLLFSSPLF